MIFLRSANTTDIDLILKWENNRENWSYSDTTEPYSRLDIENLIISLSRDGSVQQRFMICKQKGGVPIGAIDIFDVNKKRNCASVGVLIESDFNRRKGFAIAALNELEQLCGKNSIEKLNAIVHNWNTASLNLFKKAGYVEIVVEKDLIKLEKCIKK